MKLLSRLANGFRQLVKNANSDMRNAVYAAAFSRMTKMGLPASVAAVIGELVTGVVMLFVGLFMIDAVNTATAINASSAFAAVHATLLTTTGTIFTVLGLVIIVIALATAIGSLKNMF